MSVSDDTVIQDIVAREILDSRGNPTVEVMVTLLGGAVVKIGSTIYDGSVKGQLERMREQLVAAT